MTGSREDRVLVPEIIAVVIRGVRRCYVTPENAAKEIVRDSVSAHRPGVDPDPRVIRYTLGASPGGEVTTGVVAALATLPAPPAHPFGTRFVGTRVPEEDRVAEREWKRAHRKWLDESVVVVGAAIAADIPTASPEAS